jgi:oligopeptide/dipeptide ABC transporter ATP-binding protein
MAVISVFNLKKRFNLEAGFFARFGRFVYAVNDVSFSIDENESYGLVGESGCGKTTTARLLVRMYEADEGRIVFQDREDVRAMKRGELKKYRERVKYVFQDPARSLNPRMSVYDVLVSGYRWSSRRVGEKTARREAAAVLEEVGLDSADLERRPTEFSGGQRQRISIARSLLMNPDLLICDEVVSALDVSIQGQILNLLLDLRSRHSLSFLFIAHDLKVACYFCDRIGVMYRGELMEEAPAADLYRTALHPYTRLLFSSALSAGGMAEEAGGGDRKRAFEKELKTPLTETAGCAFAERCPLAEDRCFREHPVLQAAGTAEGAAAGLPLPEGHRVRCFRAEAGRRPRD